MGLHNKFPADFYKRGNLFNTYLGSGEESYRIPSPKKRPPQKTEKPRAKKQRDQEALIAFVLRFLTQEQMRTWLNHTSAAHGVPRSTQRHVYNQIALFVRENLPPDVCVRYLAELKRRREAGVPLVR